jgi:polysaccharide export outer membrane protein
MNRTCIFNSSRYSIGALVIGGLLVGQVVPAFAQVQSDSEVSSPSTSAFSTELDSSSRESLRQVEDDPYVLGPGDVVRFDIFNVPELTNSDSGSRLVSDSLYTVSVDGTLNLPWIGRVPVRGLNLDQADRAVEARYTEFILDPVVTLTVFTPRPVRIAVVGEVNRPGAYTTGAAGTPGIAEPVVTEMRTVIQAIQTAGGITQLADIRSIEVRRPQLNGSEQVIPIDFFALLDDGNQGQNLLLRDGDTVFIPTATALNPETAQALADANFSPTTVGIDVVGEVGTPGRVEIKPNSTLNQAILAAGGFDDPRANTGEVALIRLNPDGTVTNRRIPVDLAAGINEETNPALRNNDVVIVSRSGVTRNADFLELVGSAAGAILNPILGVIGILDLFNGN